MATSQYSSARSIAEWNNDTTNTFIDVCMEHLSSRAHNVGGWYQVIAHAFNERTGLDYNAGQMKNKFDNMKRDWAPWNRLLQFGGGGWDEQLDTVTGTDDWWATVPIPMRKFKSGSPARFKELDSMFAGCICTDRCQYAIPDAPLVHLQEAQLFGDIIRGDNVEISSHPTRRPVRSGAGPSRSAPSRMDRDELIDLCMFVRREEDDYQDWEVSVIMSTQDRLGHNPFYSLIGKPEQLRACVIHFVTLLRDGKM